MKPRISVITLGVNNLEKSVIFYRDGLGLKTDGIVGQEFEHGAVAFFELEGGMRLALWPHTSISNDTGIAAGSPNAAEFTLGHNVNSPGEVDIVMSKAEDAGAQIVKQAQQTFWEDTQVISKT